MNWLLKNFKSQKQNFKSHKLEAKRKRLSSLLLESPTCTTCKNYTNGEHKKPLRRLIQRRSFCV